MPAAVGLLMATKAWRFLGTAGELRRPCCASGRRCCFELREWFANTEVRGFALPQFLGMLGSLALPVADAWLDWSVIIKWYLQGDVHWAEVGLTILLISGVVSGLMLAGMLINSGWHACCAFPFGLLAGVTGLAPVAVAAFALHDEDVEKGPQKLKIFKALELVFEALPQSILQCVRAFTLAQDPCG